MLIGAHVREDDPVASAAERGADIVQMFLADPQGWKKPPSHPQAERAAHGGELAVVGALPLRRQPRVARTTASASRRASSWCSTPRRPPRSARSGWSCTGATSRRARTPAGRRQLAQVRRAPGGRGRVRRAGAHREHRGRRQRHGPRGSTRWPGSGTPSASSGSASAWTPATRSPRARTSSTSSTGPRPSRAGSTWCTSTTRATSSAPRATGTPTSATAPSTRTCWPPSARPRTRRWSWRPPREGQGADIAFLRERLGSVTPPTARRPTGRAD